MKWFKHDADANRDDRLEKVLMRYGAEGYALYWLCLELIAAPIDKHDLNFELKHDSEILAYRLKMDSAKVEEIMKYMVGIGLFEISQTSNRITCLKLASRIENSIVKNNQIKQIQALIKENNPGQSGIIRDNPRQLGNSSARSDTDTDTDQDQDQNTCAERLRLSTPTPPAEDLIPQEKVEIEIPLVDKTVYGITHTQISEWGKSFPGVDILQALRVIREWNLSNPKKQKTRSGIRKHITEWLAKDQNRGGNQPRGSPVNHTQENKPLKPEFKMAKT